MSYTVLARRYRSVTFEQVVGQEPISQTLQNAIASGRVAHAYLFCGTRGVGKTSMARIFARALNAPATIPDCPVPTDGYAYPDAEVQQRMADAIMTGDDLNVIEIDGASNRGVDEARQLIANASLAPTGNARYKIYIIDEVHMLTREAFNALLKTMEEPPEHIKFILCTTEPHKVPPTIQSRCQRFDFRNLPTARIAAHLKNVIAEEKIEADSDVLWQIARLGNGSMRDALSLMDRLIATGRTPLSSQILEEMLGLPPQTQVVALVTAMAQGQIAQTLELTDALLGSGIAVEQFFDVLIERLRQLMLIGACGLDSPLVQLPEDARKEAAEQSGHFDAAGLVHMIALCENVQRTAKISSNPRALVDAVMVRLALAEKMADVTAVLAGTSPSGIAGGGGGVKKKVVETSLEPMGVGGGSRMSPRELWAAVAKRLPPSLARLERSLLIHQIAGRVVTLKMVSEGSSVFLTDRQQASLAEVFCQVRGEPTQIQIERPVQPQSSPGTSPGSPEISPGHEKDIASKTSGGRQAAMALPLVRQIQENFSVTLIDVRSVSPVLEKKDNEPDVDV